jgi:thiol-disulfide isomerase/thioredoxin
VPLLIFALAGRQVVARVRAFRRHQRVIRIVSGGVMIVLAVALAFNVTDAIQRIVPNYTEAIGNSLEAGVAQPEVGKHGAPVSLGACQTAALYGGMDLQDCGPAPDFTGIQQWLDTPGGAPVKLSALEGHVVLVDFWAYSCINCQRELPHVEAWAKDYADAGLTVVGVHTPEYAFEHAPANVKAGAERLGLTFPIAIDNDYGTWNAYGNSSWPATYLIDATGTIRHVSAGEGDYPQEEQYIRTLLHEAHPKETLPPATDVPDTTPRDAAQSPETYLGSERAQYFGGGESYGDGTRSFRFPSHPSGSGYALAGTWTVSGESITAGAGARIRLDYHASEVYLDVSGTGTLTVRDADGTRTIAVSGAPNIYTVASNGMPQDGEVTVSLSTGLSAYSFTFG